MAIFLPFDEKQKKNRAETSLHASHEEGKKPGSTLMQAKKKKKPL
jgi:hypothetical protein